MVCEAAGWHSRVAKHESQDRYLPRLATCLGVLDEEVSKVPSVALAVLVMGAEG